LLIEDYLELILFPIKVNKIMNLNIRIYITSFILEYIKNINISDLKNKDLIFNSIDTLIEEHEGDSNILIPFWINILSEIIYTDTLNIDDRIVKNLNKIKLNLIDKFKTPFFNIEDRKNFKEVLRLIIYMKRVDLEDKTTKLKILIPYIEVISILDVLKSNYTNVTKFLEFFDVINLTIDILYLNKEFYIIDLSDNKSFLRSKYSN